MTAVVRSEVEKTTIDLISQLQRLLTGGQLGLNLGPGTVLAIPGSKAAVILLEIFVGLVQLLVLSMVRVAKVVVGTEQVVMAVRTVFVQSGASQIR